MINLKMMRFAENVVFMGEMKNTYKRDFSKDLGVDERIKGKWILGK
jgi:hypothetical protein